MKYIRTLTVLTDAEIRQNEIPLFRGAVIHSLGEHPNVYFHNHLDDEKFRYAYPLIQYKRLGGKAAIVCVEEGADVIGQFLSELNGMLRIGEREITCDISRVAPVKVLMQTWKTTFNYHINRWLPLNSKNYQIYKMADNDREKRKLLENILKANLLSMLKGLGIHLEDELLLMITQLSEHYIIYNKGIALMAFNADFCCNISIPNNVGIGKNASIGCGTIHRVRLQNKENKTSISE